MRLDAFYIEYFACVSALLDCSYQRRCNVCLFLQNRLWLPAWGAQAGANPSARCFREEVKLREPLNWCRWVNTIATARDRSAFQRTTDFCGISKTSKNVASSKVPPAETLSSFQKCSNKLGKNESQNNDCKWFKIKPLVSKKFRVVFVILITQSKLGF